VPRIAADSPTRERPAAHGPESTAPADAPRSGPSTRTLVVAAATGLAVLVGLVLLADGQELLATAAKVHPTALIEPLVFSALSYAAMSRSYQGIADAAGCHLSFTLWLRITFVSNTVNYVVSTAGLSGFAVRMLLLGQQGVSSGRAVLISLVQTFLTNFTLLFFILGGFVSLVMRRQLVGAELIGASVLLVLFAGVVVWFVLLVARPRLRRRTLLWIGEALHRILRRVAPRWAPRRVRLWRFQHQLDHGFRFLLTRKKHMTWPTIWICLDWVLTCAILWSAFRAVQYPVSPGVVLVGFSIGLLFTLVSVVPAGLGLMEGSMAAVFVGLGVPLEPAVLAILIFRLAYHLIPLVLSAFLFSGVFRQAMHATAPERV
jgi:glycosyltransferase 2 family protein